MDRRSFDALTRSLATPRRRRAVLLVGLGAVGPWLLSEHMALPAEAGKKRKKRKKRKGKTSGCQPSCSYKVCGDDGCGGSCGSCGAEQTCMNGSCQSICSTGQRLCAGACIPSNLCCADIDCTRNRQCRQGVCECTPQRPLCPGVVPEACCAPATGIEPRQFICGSLNGVPTCFCEYRAIDVCPGCTNPNFYIRPECNETSLAGACSFC
jgi:hypothetical protein